MGRILTEQALPISDNQQYQYDGGCNPERHRSTFNIIGG